MVRCYWRAFVEQLGTRIRPEFMSYGRAEFARVYDLMDCISWGTGVMMGAGVFVYLPIIIKYVTGPGTVLAYLLGGLLVYTSVFSFAELASRFPHCGGTYVYNYTVFGEFVASLMGISLLLQHLVMAADVCISLTEHIDYLVFNNSLERFEEKQFSYNFGGDEIFAGYPHFLASLLVLLISVVLTTKSQVNNFVGSWANNISFIMVALIIFVGAFFVDFNNWFNIRGGFLPYGYTSVFKGAIVILSTYLGFVDLPCLSDESVRPKQDISNATHVSFFFVLVVYVAVSVVVSLAAPYYSVNPNFAMANIFMDVNVPWMAYVVEIGSIAALFSTALCILQAASRLAFCMGRDGILFRFLGVIQPKSRVPYNAVMGCGFLGCIVPLFFDSTYLIRLSEMGYLLNCVLVNLAVILLRYTGKSEVHGPGPEAIVPGWFWDQPTNYVFCYDVTLLTFRYRAEACPQARTVTTATVTKETEVKSILHVIAISLWVVLCTSWFRYGLTIYNKPYSNYYISCIFLFIALCHCFALSRLPQNEVNSEYATPMVPWLPVGSIFVIMLIVFTETPPFVWMAEGVVLGVSLFVYSSYSFWNSRTHRLQRQHDEERRYSEEEKEVLAISALPTYNTMRTT